jgi:uncharacterized repeat protein (TIGR03803 family)
MTPKVFLRAAARPSFLSRVVTLVVAVCAITVILATSAAGASLKTIYKMNASTSDAPLVRDAAGNLYGTTEDGGNTACSGGCGTVFELSPTAAGGWKFTALHKFTGGADGELIYAGLALDASGNVYGTALRGGKYGFGDVFELSPVSGGGWKFSVLYSFQNTNDGANPSQGVTLDASGNVFGVSNTTVFELSPVSGHGWKYKTLHVLRGLQYPMSVTLDPAGNIFGVTADGGITNANCLNGCGTAFELTQVAGVWKYTLLYAFTGNADGAMPLGSLTLDALGNLYGVSGLGGNIDSCPYGCGTVFELTPSGSAWTETVLLAFDYTDGEQPHGQLVFDASGNLYGTTEFDSASNCACGVAYELTPGSAGNWTQTVLHVFAGGSDGSFPYAGLVSDGSGHFYGTTESGGNTTGTGTVFEVTP